MKEMTKMSRLTGCLERCFRLINEDLFDGELPMPVITCVPTAKEYTHLTAFPAADRRQSGRYELNISSAYLREPLTNIVASLVHEACHLSNHLHNVHDTSNNGVYHNKRFKRAAEEHGLLVYQDEKYGWCITVPGDKVLAFTRDHMDELSEIEMNRNVPHTQFVSIAPHIKRNALTAPLTAQLAPKKSSYRRWHCPKCGAIVRSTSTVNVFCGDCLVSFIEG